MAVEDQLGHFLRSQRARLTPGEVGLPEIGPRRVKGLRREEVAVLAGVSVDYYARLEQGRERTPSSQMMDAICTALHLGADARDHAYRLARLTSTTPAVVAEQVSPELRQMMDNVPNAAAYIVNPAFRVLAANRTAMILIGPDQYDQPVRYLFLNPAARRYFLNWEEVARTAVSGLRLAAGYNPPHSEVAAIVGQLREESREFSTWWDDHTVAGLAVTHKKIHHPEVGRLELSYQTFDVRDAPGQQLVVATAPSASPSSDALALLGTLDATRRSPTQR
jgi:transcriptional regulator with XRE-family HTH domain